MSTAAQPFCRHVSDYSALVQALHDRTKQMEMSQREVDHIAGLADGHTEKILSPARRKTLGLISLGSILHPGAMDSTLSKAAGS